MKESADWWKSAVIYQIYPRSFCDSNGDGVGDLNGITERIDYLADVLGVDAVWISPFYASPMADFGYDVSDYCDVDPLFGTVDDARKMIEAFHARSIRVIVDYVPNHCSIEHEWFKDACRSKHHPKRDWFIWADPGSDGAPPNNWVSVFGGSQWTLHEPSGQFYLHRFLAEQPDLNWRNPELVAAMHDVLRFWLDMGVDGFRIDAPVSLMRDPQLRDNPMVVKPESEWEQGESVHNPEYEAQEHINDIHHPELHDVLKGMRGVLDAYDPPGSRVAIAEVEPLPWPEWVRYYGDNLDEVQVPFNFELMGAPWESAVIKGVVDGFEAALPRGAWPNYTLGNHDKPRLATRYGDEHCRLAAMLLLTLRGTPTLYYGDELGVADIDVDDDAQQDPYGRRVPGCGRDGCRAPMVFDGSDGHGFTGATKGPWLPFPEDASQQNVDSLLKEPRSVLQLYRQLIELRRAHTGLHRGDYSARFVRNESVFCFGRQSADERFLVALNFSDGDVSVSLAGTGSGRIALSTELDRDGAVPLDDVSLRPREGLVIEVD